MPPEEEPQKQRIDALTAFGMIALALFFDGLQFFATLAGTVLTLIPVVGLAFTGMGVMASEFVSLLSVCIFGIWFSSVGVSYFDRNGATKMIITLASVVTELVGLVNAIPAITFGVVCLIIITRAEDGKPGIFGILSTVSTLRRAGMNREQRSGADAWAVQRIARDEKSPEARRVEAVRKKNNIEDFSSPTLREYYKKPPTNDTTGAGEEAAEEYPREEGA